MEPAFTASFPTFREVYACAYFDDGRTAAMEYLFPDERLACEFHRFLAHGYRRIGSIFYRNVCTGCAACVPLRVRTADFVPSRSQKRTARANRDVRVEVHRDSEVTAGKTRLYRKYLLTKHAEKGRHEVRNFDAELVNIHYGYPDAIEMDYFLGDRLIGVGVVDEAEDGLSANYFYYDTDFLGRRLGVWSVLQEIALARRLGKSFYYLGYFIGENPKMAYKRQFRPNQALENGTWRDFMGA